ncbi:6059_t:CDS:2 [Funneliformis geosporum]|uniref:RNA-binding protein VTS1 n=1 Tax=Funneliformis geosporum TaxID=1117311 RepID=A0A9W4SRV1_9GLOM|nr:6059_t:CDS:2 [Funneliformis geosporum]
MTTQRPVSEQFNLQPAKSGSNSQYRQSADLSHLGQQPTNHRSSRPTSEIFSANNHNTYQSPEAEAIDKWFEDLQHYEQTLEEMATASLDQNFKEELSAIEQWFRVLSEAERTAALYSLLQHSTQVQIRFFITVLQQMARSDPMGALLSPANPEKDLMQAQLAGAMAKAEVEAKLAGMSLKSPTSPTYPRNRLYDRHSGVEFLSPEAAIYSDPAAALAQQRARLQANTGNRSASLYSSRPKSMVAETDQSVWAPTTAFPLRSPRPGTGAFDGELSPLVGGSWASMVSTPVVPMFAENKNKQSTDVDLVNKKLTNWSISNSSGNRVVLESDVKKFRRNHGKNNNSGVPATVQEEKYNTANIVLAMYDADGNIRSPQQSPIPSPKTHGSRQSSRPTSPNPNPTGGLYPIHSGWGPSTSSGKGTHLTPPNVGVPYSDENGEVGGYHSDHSDASHHANNSKGHNSGGGGGGVVGKNKKKPNDDTVDFNLLQDIPQWLRSLRLHKYTPVFEGMNYKEIIELDDTELEQKGVAALGARRKMLKEFEKVKKAMAEMGS